MWLKRSTITKKWPIVLASICVIGVLIFLGVKWGPKLKEAVKELPASLETTPPPSTPEEIKLKEIETQLGQAIQEKGSKTYKEKAEKGEGLTHLARRALKNYLQDFPQNPNLSPEHKIYIEDYLALQKGYRWLNLGEEIEFTKEEIEGAIQKALQLTPEQLHNLSQFVQLVPNL